jgi:uncharacterized protein (TIGR02145 family)
MPLPSSGQISLGDIANEFDYELSNISLRTLSQKASKGQPDAVSEFYNFTYNYPTVQIVNQVWFSESLRRKKYVDGVAITDGTSNWTDVTSGRYAFPNDTPINRNDYGLLYNFYALNNSSGSELCPAGFRPPLSSEVTSLIGYVGVPSLKTVGTTYWNTANGTNTSGYGAMGSGWRANNMVFSQFKNIFYWWSSDQYFLRINDDNSSGISGAGAGVNAGFSMRCMTLKSYYFLLLSNGGVYYYDMAANTINSLSLFSSGAFGIAMTGSKLWVMFDTTAGFNLQRFSLILAPSISVTNDGAALVYTGVNATFNGIEKIASDGSTMFVAGGDRIYVVNTSAGGTISNSGSFQIVGGTSRGGIALKNDYYVTITKTSGSNNNWNDAQAYSTNGYVDRIVISAYAQQTNAYIMFGLNTDPKTNASYDSIDYAWYFNGSPSEAYIYESGSSVGINAGAYTTSTILTIIYENNEVKYYKDGTLIRSVSRTAGTPLYFDSSIYTLNGSFVLTNFNTFFNIGKNPNVVGSNVTITPTSVFQTTYSTFTVSSVQSVYKTGSLLHNISSITNPFAMSCDASFIYIFADNLVYRFTDSIPPQRLNINGTDVVIPIPAETQIFGVAQI